MSNATHQVNIPSILLILTGALGILLALLGIIQVVIGTNELDPSAARQHTS